MKYFLIFIWIFLFTLGCPAPVEEEPARLSNNGDDRDSRSARCSDESLRDESLVLNRPDIISSRNAGSYSLSGRCSTAERYVELSIGRASQEVNCSGGRWEADLDITNIVQDQEEVSISAQSGSNEVCSTVRNSFLCPDGYIPVPRLVNDNDIPINYDFCVMQNEASSESGRDNRQNSYSRDINRQRQEYQDQYSERAVSSGRDPWINLSLQEAERRCSNNGIGYRLISNNEWQVIARNIEAEPLNWFFEETTIDSGNFLNPGVAGYGGSSRNRSSSRENGTPTHYLPNGAEIENFGGGVWEMVSDSTSIIKGSTNTRNVFELSGDFKDLFGPRRNYSNAVASNRDGYSNLKGLGLGAASLSRINDIIARGGTEDRDIGVFSVRADLSSNRLDGIGFRCVYRP